MNSELKILDVNRNRPFLRGFICAVVSLITINEGVTPEIRSLFRMGVGQLTLGALENRGVEEYDLSVLEKYWYELH